MKRASYRGVVRGQTIVLSENAASLADGTEVLVMPLPLEPGTPGAVLAAMESEPHLTREDIEELQKAIDQGRRQPAHVQPFPGESE